MGLCYRDRMKQIMAAIAAITLVTIAAPDADARPRPSRASRFSANKTFGAGIMLGEPSGLSAKYFLGQDTALDFGLGAYRYYRHRSGFDLHADFLFHPVNLVHTEPFELPLYFGLGARLLDFDLNDDARDDHGFALGVRVPLGIAFDFNNVPLDVFIELAVVIDFFFDYYDDYGGDVNGAVGVRYYFN
jgi:opacity protein-like surface antigen